MSDEVIRKFAEQLLTGDHIDEDQLELLENAIAAHPHITEEEQHLVDAVGRRVRRQEEIDAAHAALAARRIGKDGVVTREDLQELHDAIMADGHISSEEQMVLQSIVNQLRMKRLHEE